MGEAPPSERVFVSGLPAGMDDGKLNAIFGAYGTLKDIKNLSQSNSCILNFASLDEAKWVVENLDGNMPEGINQPVSVKFANPPHGYGKGKGGDNWGQNRSYPYGGGKGGKGGDFDGGKGSASVQILKKGLIQAGVLPGTGKGSKSDAKQLYIRGLPSDTSDIDLSDIFAPFGAIPPRGVKAMLNPDGSCTGVGFVDYVEEACAQAALNALNGTMMPDGTTLRVSVKNSSKAKGKGWGKAEGKSEAAQAAQMAALMAP